MGFISEFKEFAMRGNVMDMAVGLVLGAAFKDIVTALVSKIIMPITGAMTGGVNFADQSTTLDVPNLPVGMEPPVIGWGAFVQAGIDFLLVALAIFVVIKIMNSAKKKEEPAPEKTPEDIALLREIRDSLKKA